jgi:tRNA threonylcarbamoyladenosine biosynthesis protein TsaE
MTAIGHRSTRESEAWPLPTRRETRRLARAIGQCLKSGDLVVLTGELGAGKTFLVRGICRALGLAERVRVTSPTFTLVHEYQTKPGILHADLYRLDRAADVRQIGLQSQRDDGWVLIVEWGEPFMAELGGDALVVSFSAFPRGVRLASTGSRSAEMLAQIWNSRHETLRFEEPDGTL